MPLHLSWDDSEQTIIRCESEGHWTWEEYHAALDQVVEMMRGVNRRVDLINVERPGASIPPGSPTSHFKRSTKILPANLGINVVVIASSVGRMMASVMKLMPGNDMDSIRLVRDLEQAYALIAEERAKEKPPVSPEVP
jgi:hypothetical protein